jgi:hypothetical protein
VAWERRGWRWRRGVRASGSREAAVVSMALKMAMKSVRLTVPSPLMSPWAKVLPEPPKFETTMVPSVSLSSGSVLHVSVAVDILGDPAGFSAAAGVGEALAVGGVFVAFEEGAPLVGEEGEDVEVGVLEDDVPPLAPGRVAPGPGTPGSGAGDRAGGGVHGVGGEVGVVAGPGGGVAVGEVAGVEDRAGGASSQAVVMVAGDHGSGLYRRAVEVGLGDGVLVSGWRRRVARSVEQRRYQVGSEPATPGRGRDLEPVAWAVGDQSSQRTSPVARS